jgi:pimeloyl-ACP methyl ester carboxylesterase
VRASPDRPSPAQSAVPALLISGHLDPATSPRWAAETARLLPNNVQLVVPGGHSPTNPCTEAISTAFVLAGSLEHLDTSCTAGLRSPPVLLSPA